MARIPMTNGFALLPEGEQVLQIISQKYDEDFGKLEIQMVNASGIKHTERFMLLGKDGQPNEGAMNAFSYFAKTAMDDFEMADIDPAELVGHFIRTTVEYDIQPNRNHPEKTVKFVRLGDKSPASGFDGAVTQTAPASTTAPAPVTESGDLDLAALLGN